MDQDAKAQHFAALHQTEKPLSLFNIWDAGSARAIAEIGASACATSSYAVAQALGFDDGEDAPLDVALDVLARIVAATDLPVTHDVERGYGQTPDVIARNCARVIAIGAIGLNIEDSLPHGALRSIESHVDVLSAVKTAMTAECNGAWLNARTDVFLRPDATEEEKVSDAISRGRAYADAGANSLFTPFTQDLQVLSKIAAEIPIPINAMRALDGPPLKDFAAAGVARVSHGAYPNIAARRALQDDYRATGVDSAG